jgi:ribosomal-protein-alanine N-acetyltransferase
MCTSTVREALTNMIRDGALGFPQISTGRLRLTQISSSDGAALFAMFANPDVVRYYDLAPLTDLLQAEKLIELFASRHRSGLGIRWAIRLGQSEELIGTCGFNSWSDKMRNATIGYDLHPAHWRRGYATEAVAAAISAAFSGRLPCGLLHRIQADVIPGNAASEKLLLKLGFREEGVRRESAYLHGAFHDMKCFGLLKPEFITP